MTLEYDLISLSKIHIKDALSLIEGLADAYDDEELDARLISLEDIWEGLLPGFYDWFKKNR